MLCLNQVLEATQPCYPVDPLLAIHLGASYSFLSNEAQYPEVYNRIHQLHLCNIVGSGACNALGHVALN